MLVKDSNIERKDYRCFRWQHPFSVSWMKRSYFIIFAIAFFLLLQKKLFFTEKHIFFERNLFYFSSWSLHSTVDSTAHPQVQWNVFDSIWIWVRIWRRRKNKKRNQNSECRFPLWNRCSHIPRNPILWGGWEIAFKSFTSQRFFNCQYSKVISFS